MKPWERGYVWRVRYVTQTENPRDHHHWGWRERMRSPKEGKGNSQRNGENAMLQRPVELQKGGLICRIRNSLKNWRMSILN